MDSLENEVEVGLEVLQFILIARTQDGVSAPRVPHLACIRGEADFVEFLYQRRIVPYFNLKVFECLKVRQVMPIELKTYEALSLALVKQY